MCLVLLVNCMFVSAISSVAIRHGPDKLEYDPEKDIEYFLYTRKMPESGQKIVKGNTNSIMMSYFDANKPVKLTVHGWNGDLTSNVNTKIRPAFLNIMDVNVIAVDWSKGCKSTYEDAVANVPKTGRSVGEFLDWLNTRGVPFSRMHVIGHSLGGQLVGFICRSTKRGRVQYLTSNTIYSSDARENHLIRSTLIRQRHGVVEAEVEGGGDYAGKIATHGEGLLPSYASKMGLDPALPLWKDNPDGIRKSDAKYVEVIHTNSGYFGLADAAGDNDFYPNGGVRMPGCAGDSLCSHARCIDYFAESVDNKDFIATHCSNVNDAMNQNCSNYVKLHMGAAKVKNAYGIFSLETNAVSPYHKS